MFKQVVKWFLIGGVLMAMVQSGLLLALAILASIWSVGESQVLRLNGLQSEFGAAILLISLLAGLLSAIAAQWRSCTPNCRRHI